MFPSIFGSYWVAKENFVKYLFVEDGVDFQKEQSKTEFKYTFLIESYS